MFPVVIDAQLIMPPFLEQLLTVDILLVRLQIFILMI